MYIARELCQKHYFRFMRNGHYGLNKRYAGPGKKRMRHSNGYILLRIPGHPLAQKSCNVYEHRKIIYDAYGENLPPCEFCGKPSDWHSRKTHIDHIDENRANNDLSNLRVLCNPCNVGRAEGRPKHTHIGRSAITVDGVTMTPAEWARQPGVVVTGATIIRRVRLGWPPKEAVYRTGITHHGSNKQAKPRILRDEAREECE